MYLAGCVKFDYIPQTWNCVINHNKHMHHMQIPLQKLLVHLAQWGQECARLPNEKIARLPN
jgi:hypothetical protein